MLKKNFAPIRVTGIIPKFLFNDGTQCNSGGFLGALFAKLLIQEVVFVFRHLSSALSDTIFYTKKTASLQVTH